GHATPASNRTLNRGAQPVTAPRVTPRTASDKPPAKRTFPAGSSFSRPGRAPGSLRRAYAQIVANTPKGTLIQKIDCQPRRAVRTPPATRPIKAPAVPAPWLSPSARPRSETGNASVRIAALFANKSPAPIPWTSRNRTRLVPFGARLHRPEPIVKIANPRLYSRTRPDKSASRPIARRRLARTSTSPKMIQLPSIVVVPEQARNT